MHQMIDLAQQARKLLPSAMNWCNPDAAARRELRASGVPTATVRSLYPFDLDAYLKCAADLIRNPDRFAPLSLIFTKDSDNAVASAPARVQEPLWRKFLASAYERELGLLPQKSPSPTTRRTPPVVFRQWTLTLLYLNELAQLPSFPVVVYSIQGAQMAGIRYSVSEADRYFAAHPIGQQPMPQPTT